MTKKIVFLKTKLNVKTFEDLRENDLKCIACILCEIIFFNKLKCLPDQNNLHDRYGLICKSILHEPHMISG